MTARKRSKTPGKKGRPKFVIDENQLKRLAALQHTIEEMAFALGCSPRTLKRQLQEQKLRDVYEAGKAGGRSALKRLQWRHAQMANSAGVQMTIHLSKHWLGETDKAALELTGKEGGPIETRDVSAKEVIASRIASIAARKGETEGPSGADGQPG